MIATTTIRVRYGDTDCMKVVYYSNYLTYFEVGRVEYLRQQGMSIADINEKIHMPGVEALVRFVKPARLDDLLAVHCWVGERKRASFRFGYAIRDAAGVSVATGHTLHPCREPATIQMTAPPPRPQPIMP